MKRYDMRVFEAMGGTAGDSSLRSGRTRNEKTVPAVPETESVADSVVF